MEYNPYAIKLDWEKNFKIPISFNLKKDNFEMIFQWKTEQKEKHTATFEENKNQTLKIHLKDDINIEQEKPLKWRKFSPFLDFFM